MQELLGTVPYLGPYLTALEYVNAATSDYTETGLIAFEKRRKEFDLLAKVKLFQV